MSLVTSTTCNWMTVYITEITDLKSAEKCDDDYYMARPPHIYAPLKSLTLIESNENGIYLSRVEFLYSTVFANLT